MINKKNKKRCILIGGTPQDCINWLERNNLLEQFKNIQEVYNQFIFARTDKDIEGLHNVEVIEIDNAELNPLYKCELLERIRIRR